MKKIITIATPEIVNIASCFIRNQSGYAKANGYEYEAVPTRHWEHLHPSFSKVYEMDQALKAGCEIVIWADCDVAFMNYHYDLGSLLSGDYWMASYLQQNWSKFKYLCAGLIVIRNTQEARGFVREWADRCLRGCPEWKPGIRTPVVDHPWEQWHYSSLIQGWEYKGIRCCNAYEIGCFCPEIWHDGVIWKTGMPTIHMAGPSTWDNRADIFNRVYAKQVKRI